MCSIRFVCIGMANHWDAQSDAFTTCFQLVTLTQLKPFCFNLIWYFPYKTSLNSVNLIKNFISLYHLDKRIWIVLKMSDENSHEVIIKFILISAMAVYCEMVTNLWQKNGISKLFVMDIWIFENSRKIWVHWSISLILETPIWSWSACDHLHMRS